MRATAGAWAPSTATSTASLSERTWPISSAVNRYDMGTATRPSLRQACMKARTWRLLGPHHTARSPLPNPRAASPPTSRFTIRLSSA